MIATAAQIAEANRVLARRDPNHWVESAWKNKKGLHFRQGAIHRAFQDAVSEHQHVLYETHRFGGKTSQSIARILWEHGNDLNLQTALVCDTDDQAKKRLNEIKLNVQRNPDVKRIFPELEIEMSNATRILFKRPGISKDPSIEAHGILSSGTGNRADLIVFDDVCNRKNTLTQPGLRGHVKEAYNDWMSLLGPEGRSWYLFTQWHNEDLSQDLKNRGKIPLVRKLVEVQWTSAGVPRRIEPVWPEKWDAKRLYARWDLKGTRAFKRDFCGQAVDDAERVIWPEWFQFGPPPFPLASAVRVQIWDGAAPRKTRSTNQDYMAYVDMYVSPLAGMVYFADAWRARGLRPSEQVAAVKSRLLFGPRPSYLVVEQQGESALAALIDESGMVPPEVTLIPITSEGKRKEVRAAEYLAPIMEGKQVVFAPKLDPEENEEAPPIKSELVELQFGDHDDLADCAVYGARIAKQLVRFGISRDIAGEPEIEAEVDMF